MSVDKLSIVVFSGDFARIHYALVLAAGAAASNRPVTLFFTMGAAQALVHPDGWMQLPTLPGQPTPQQQEETFVTRKVAGFQDLLEACIALNVTFMVCEMGLRALDLTLDQLRPDITIQPGGVVTFLADASRDGGMLMV